MQFCENTLRILASLILGDGLSNRRTGRDLVLFFQEHGFDDVYWERGYEPRMSRGKYTYKRLQAMNGTDKLGKCIQNIFAVSNYSGRLSELDELIARFNAYLILDNYVVVRNNDIITIITEEKSNGQA